MFTAKFAALVALAPFALAAQDGLHSLKYRPKVDEQSTYKFEGKLKTDQFDLDFAMKYFQKCTKVAEDGAFSLSVKIFDGKVSFAGQEQEIPEVTEELEFDKDGNEIKKANDEEGNDPFEAVFSMLDFEPKAPVRMGAEFEVKTDMVHLTNKLVSEEKVDDRDTLKIDIKGKFIKEGYKGDISGTVNLDKSSYEMVRAKMKVSGAEFGEGVPSGDVELTMSKIPN